MIRLLRLSYNESAACVAGKINTYLEREMRSLESAECLDSEIGAVCGLAAEIKEWSWEPRSGQCIYIITRDTLWEQFERLLLLRTGVEYVAVDVLDEYYSGAIALPRLRRRIQRYLKYWLTSDEVLDKITRHGMQSLTPLDYIVLQQASTGV